MVAPSILSADFTQLLEEVRLIEKAGANRLHLDIMDGHFTPQITFGAGIVQAISNITSLPLDAHLMVTYPQHHISALAKSGVCSITVHIESQGDIKKTLQQIRDAKVQAGITLKPDTPVESIFPFLNMVDIVLIMTVNPGASGQKFLPGQVDKIYTVKKEIKRLGLNNISIQVDGGINSNLLPVLEQADVLISGDFIFKHKDYKTAISLLQNKEGVM